MEYYLIWRPSPASIFKDLFSQCVLHVWVKQTIQGKRKKKKRAKVKPWPLATPIFSFKSFTSILNRTPPENNTHHDSRILWLFFSFFPCMSINLRLVTEQIVNRQPNITISWVIYRNMCLFFLWNLTWCPSCNRVSLAYLSLKWNKKDRKKWPNYSFISPLFISS